LQKNLLSMNNSCYSFKPWLCSFLIAVALLCLLCSGAALASQKSGALQPRIQGTFLQLTAAQGNWQQADWKRLFGYFKELHLTQVIIQWTVYDDLAFFPLKGCREVAPSPLPIILQLADAAGLKVWVGLAYDSDFWGKINRDPKLVEVYLRRLRLQAEAIAMQLAPDLQRHPSFQGWYITPEIDDVNWESAKAREILFAFLRNLSGFLHKLTPEAEVAISGFSNARTDPKTFGCFWQALLGDTSIDRVLFQDGIGAGKLKLDGLSIYLESLRQAVQTQQRQLQVVVELFHQTCERPFRAQPASWQSVLCQLNLASRFATRGIVAFSIPEYMTPSGGPKADKLFNSYKDFIQGK
jgi:hypothetical protein